MATSTEFLNLIKPDITDYYDIQESNKNLDIIDQNINNMNNSINNKQERIDVPNGSLIKKYGDDIVRAIPNVDYLSDEIGTWTPSLQSYNNGSWMEFIYRERRGRYAKSGSLLNCFFDLKLSSIFNTNTSFIVLKGLPYLPRNYWFNGCSIVLWGQDSSGAFSTTSYGLSGDLESSYLKFRYISSTGSKPLLTPSHLGSISNIVLRGNITYTIN